MYVPHLEAICRNIGLAKEEIEGSGTVQIPASFLKFLLQVVIATGEFNEAGYLASNPDVAQAVQEGKVPNPRLHYVLFGFFEGRLGATPEVNEEWYRNNYKDVGDAVKSGVLKSAREHFIVQGAAEGRSPNESFRMDANQWKIAFGLT